MRKDKTIKKMNRRRCLLISVLVIILLVVAPVLAQSVVDVEGEEGEDSGVGTGPVMEEELSSQELGLIDISKQELIKELGEELAKDYVLDFTAPTVEGLLISYFYVGNDFANNYKIINYYLSAAGEILDTNKISYDFEFVKALKPTKEDKQQIITTKVEKKEDIESKSWLWLILILGIIIIILLIILFIYKRK